MKNTYPQAQVVTAAQPVQATVVGQPVVQGGYGAQPVYGQSAYGQAAAYGQESSYNNSGPSYGGGNYGGGNYGGGNMSTQPFETAGASGQYPGENANPGKPYFPLTAEHYPTEEMRLMVRNGFARKVFANLAFQLSITFAIAFYFVFNSEVAIDFVINNRTIVMIAVFAPLGFVCCMHNCMDTLRTFPNNIILLSLLSICFGISTGIACLGYTTDSVIMVFGITAIISVGLIFFAMQTQLDFTGMGPYLCCALLSGIAFVLISSLFTPIGPYDKFIGCGFAFLFGCYIVYDVQVIVKGKPDQIVFVDDWALATFLIYLDIINMFRCLLLVMGSRQGD